ncbi:uncharacterized protein LOC125022798 [Mugil cephalus]|uniref:uncharacterized protein LOC125022798 n=1 Tax=Mugil cephalus TaxID=48193 RepID=UPI001FB833E0|nr:uncharacterized protein LOC125022798 [Mugil cephalus]
MNNLQENTDASSSTPSVKELEKVLYGGKRFGNHADEVWPNLFIGDMSVANDRYSLWKLGITHVLNAAHGKTYCQGSHDFYGSGVDYYGVPADDSPSFDLSRYFFPSAEYIHSSLDTPGARVLVHCAVGVSRSASLVLAYLMIRHHHTLLEAIDKVKERRWIFPNRGFLKQLRALDVKLKRDGPDDSTHFDLDVYFQPAADFIHKALKSPHGKVLVHCIMGMSRSSTLVLAYLMIYRRIPLQRALQKLIQKRAIYPNRNFLALLLDLDLQLTKKKKTSRVVFIALKQLQRGRRVVFFFFNLFNEIKAEVENPDPDMPRGLSCLASPEGPQIRYETPPASELQRLMWTKKGTSNHLDEVQPRIYIGDMHAAKDKRTLQAHLITHVLNAADGKFNVNTGPGFYRDTKITYHGVEAFDMPSFNLSPFFYPAANFIKKALSSPTGKVFVHCAMGLSRSSTLVLAYLMIHENMTLVDALKAVGANRNIAPNNGFLEQLRELDMKLHCQGSSRSTNGRT